MILIYIAIPLISGAKILGVLMTESKSHYSNLRNVADEMASRGYEVCDLTELVSMCSIGVTCKTDHSTRNFCSRKVS